MSSTLMILIDFIFRLATLLFLTRFLLQISGADFYNPISQAVVKASDTICKPLRAFIKPIQNIDLASFIAAWLICIISVAAFTLLQYNTAPDPLLAIGAGFIKTPACVDSILQVDVNYYRDRQFCRTRYASPCVGTLKPAAGAHHGQNKKRTAFFGAARFITNGGAAADHTDRGYSDAGFFLIK